MVFPKGAIALLGLHVPRMFFVVMQKSEDPSQPNVPGVMSIVLRDFTGMENSEAAIRDAILAFSYNLALGNMDAAYKVVKFK